MNRVKSHAATGAVVQQRLTLISTVFLVAAMLFAVPSTSAAVCPSILEQRFNRLQDDHLVDLCQYAEKGVLVVSTPSFRSFTHQYTGLEKRYADNRERSRVVLGLPVNDFANLEPGGNKQITNFCRRNDGVALPMLEKSPVVRPSTNLFYKVLAQSTGDRPQWNFHKHLVGRNSREVLGFRFAVESGDARLTAQLERMLNAEVRP